MGLKYEIMDENGGFVRKQAHILNQREISHPFDHSNVSKPDILGNLDGTARLLRTKRCWILKSKKLHRSLTFEIH